MNSKNVSRSCDLTFTTGVIYHIHEILDVSSRPNIGSSIKLLGQIEDHSPLNCRAILSLENHNIEINTKFLAGVRIPIGELCHIIGELEASDTIPDSIQLNARVISSAQGLDVKLWNEALELRRQFLNEQ
mmetsp:Transcript_14275/g.18540  ORF Transcript_14275/g.18540 Transcript_14275/m.18540 type:complete len:130 (-) Transcript_14275:129-518(-)